MATGTATESGSLVYPPALTHQTDILLDPARFKVVNCGRRWGKTAMGHLATVRGHGPTPGFHRGLTTPDTRIWWVAPNYPTLHNSRIWEQLKRSTRDCTAKKSEVDREIILTNGSSVAVRSADNPDSLRGPGLHGVVIDEAAFLGEVVWENAIRPALADLLGWAIMISTPNGRNWFYRRHCMKREGWASWTQETSDNPLVTPQELADILADIGPRRAAQELGAKFLEIEGALWPSSYFEDQIWADRWPDAFELSCIAFDPAKSKASTADYSAIVFAGLSGSKIWIDATIERFNPNESVNAIARMYDRYSPIVVAVESISFQSLFCEIFDLWSQNNGRPPLPIIPLQHTVKGIKQPSKEERIQRLDPYLAGDKIRFKRSPGCSILVEQLMMFPSNDVHDDGPDALEMAVRMLNQLVSRNNRITQERQEVVRV